MLLIVPPAIVNVPVPSAELLLMFNVPAERVTPPPCVLAPVRVSVPAPALVSKNEPAPSSITPPTVKALVVLRDGTAGTVTEAEIIEHCRGRMAHYKCPTSVEFRDALARTATGKLQKFKLRSPYWEGRERLVN